MIRSGSPDHRRVKQRGVLLASAGLVALLLGGLGLHALEIAPVPLPAGLLTLYTFIAPQARLVFLLTAWVAVVFFLMTGMTGYAGGVFERLRRQREEHAALRQERQRAEEAARHLQVTHLGQSLGPITVFLGVAAGRDRVVVAATA